MWAHFWNKISTWINAPQQIRAHERLEIVMKGSNKNTVFIKILLSIYYRPNDCTILYCSLMRPAFDHLLIICLPSNSKIIFIFVSLPLASILILLIFQAIALFFQNNKTYHSVISHFLCLISDSQGWFKIKNRMQTKNTWL